MDRVYTEEYLEKKTDSRTTNRVKYIEKSVLKLKDAISGQELLHPKEIKLIISQMLNDILSLEEAALDTYDNLPKYKKQEIDRYYNENIAINKNTMRLSNTPFFKDEDKEIFYKRQDEILADTKNKIKSRLN